MAILINKKIPFVSSSVRADANGRYVIVTGSLFNLSVTLVNIYAPNFDDPQFFSHVSGLIPFSNSHMLIMGG